MPFDRELIEARLALDLIASADLPQVAVDALEAGVDGKATLRLAAFERPTFFEVRDLLPQAMNEMGLVKIAKGEAAKRLARNLAGEILKAGKDPLRHLHEFKWLWIRSGYAREIVAVGNLEDEIFIRNATEQEDQAYVRVRLRELLS